MMSRMLQYRKWFAVLVLPFLFACSDSNNNDPGTDPGGPGDGGDMELTQVRVTHASPDAPAVNVYIDGELALGPVEFKESSGLVELEGPVDIEVEVRGILPDGSEVSVIGPVTLTLEGGIRTDVLALGNLFDGEGNLSIAPKVLDGVEIEEGITDVRVSVVHAAPGVGTVDIYVTAPGDDLSAASPITASFEDAAGPVALAADTEYRIRITPTDTDTVVFDSGTLSFAAGTELVVAAVENTYKVGPSPVTLLAIGPEGASEVLDAGQWGAVRVVHNSADTPPVDVLVDGTEVLDAVPFTAASAYSDIEAAPGTYMVTVAADVDNTIAPIMADLPIAAAQSQTVIALGSFADSSITALVTDDDRRNIATTAKVEVIHGSYLVAAEIPVDVYLTADGVIADVEPAIPGLAYGETTGQLPLTPGDYWVTVTAAGDKSVVAFDSGATLALEGGVNYTVIARDPSAEEVSGSPLINVILLTD